MSEKSKGVKLSKSNWITIFFCGMGMTAFDIQYLARNFYALYKDATGTSDAQMGVMLSAIGVAAVIAYFYNGFLSDIVPPRIVLTFAYSMCTVCALILLTNPNYLIATVIFCIFALTPLWAPVTKIIAMTTSEEASGKVFGWLDSFNGLTGLAIGFLGSFAVSMSNSALGIRLIIIAHAVMSFLSLIGVQIICRGNKALSTRGDRSSEDRISVKSVLILIRDPNQWLVWLGIAFGYTGYIGLTYLSPMLVEYFGASTAAVTAIDTVRQYGITFILPVIAGILSDRVGAVRSYFLWLAFYIVSMAVILIVPWGQAFYFVGVASIILLACSVKGRSPLSSSMLTNVRTPLYLFGSSVGLESLLLTLPDTFCYTIAGNLIEEHGATGYHYVFAGCLVFALAGLVCNIILDRRMKAGKTSDKFFAQFAHKETEA